ncbi:rho GTPase-activating protein 26-like [Artemia franciscana]|uniref:rho GTPase-activating protein 26-like n=1 Tax=Artemia franciscana TaxID=6661 RepID=UPI0032D9E9D0
MVLHPLEYTECLTDSPHFRENLKDHERELDRTNASIKQIIKQIKELHSAAVIYSKCHRNLGSSLQNFQFECIGTTLTDDEQIISSSLKEFSKLINLIEDERDRLLEKTLEQFVAPLESFRKNQINKAKDAKKRFEKQSVKFNASQERTLGLSTKKQDFKEADALLEFEQKAFVQTSLEYVFCLQEVHERKKFEFVETLIHLISSFLTFYHMGHEVAKDFKPYMTDLQIRVQRTRENFDATYSEAQLLMRRTLEIRQTKLTEPSSFNKTGSREGYLYLLDKKAFGSFGSTWSKQYCKYLKENRVFTMMTCNLQSGKITATETVRVRSCVRRSSDSIEKRFCFDIFSDDKTFTLQALGDDDCRQWVDAMDGKEQIYTDPCKLPLSDQTQLDTAGYNFVTACITELESRGLEEQGLYRIVGVGSKVQKLLAMGLDKRKSDSRPNWLGDPGEWETKTITSALKMYFRNLPESLMTYNFHSSFIVAAKNENRNYRIQDIHLLVHRLPEENFKFLNTLIEHLTKVAAVSEKNLMTISNLGVCFGPTLLRPETETMTSIIDIKFSNIVVEILIENYSKIFHSVPDVQIEVRINGEPPPAYNPPPSYPFRHSVENIPSVKEVPRSNYMSIPPPPSQTRQKAPRSMADPHNITHAVVTSFYDGPSRPITVSSGDSLSVDWRKKGSIAVPQAPKRQKQSNAFPSLGVEPVDSTTDTSSSESNTSSRPSSREPKISPEPVRKPLSSDTLDRVMLPSTLTGNPSGRVRRVRTLYACRGDNQSELSFEPNQIITNVLPSKEPGWLEGMLNGKVGLIPENYVEYLP